MKEYKKINILEKIAKWEQKLIDDDKIKEDLLILKEKVK